MALSTILETMRLYLPGMPAAALIALANQAQRSLVGRWPWAGLNKTCRIITQEPYTIGTCIMIAGSSAVIGVGTAWNVPDAVQALTTREIRINDEDAFYGITAGTAALITMDANYAGDDDADATYSIFARKYSLSDCGEIREVIYGTNKPLERKSAEQLFALDPTRKDTGEPEYWAYESLANGIVTIDLYPVPDDQYVLLAVYSRYASTLSALTDVALVPEDLVAMLGAYYGLLSDAVRGRDPIKAQVARELYQQYQIRLSDETDRDTRLHPISDSIKDFADLDEAETGFTDFGVDHRVL
ncbi:MAG: hypothetical protein WC449_05480 [Candidatus Paceibacterota bacterium]